MSMTVSRASERSAAQRTVAAMDASNLLRSVIESLLLLLLLRAIERLFFGPGAFSLQQIHPFWIVVLIASVQSGLFAGVITAALATLVMEWPARPIGMDITEYYLSVAVVPIQWLLVALIIGLFRQGQIHAERQLAGENNRLREANETLAGEVVRLDALLRQVELETVTAPARGATVSEALAATARLEEATPESIVERFSDAALAWGVPSARCLLNNGEQGFVGPQDGRAIAGLDEPLSAGDPHLRPLSNAARPILVEQTGATLALCGVRGGSRRALIAVVAMKAEDAVEAGSALVAAEVLARAVGAALTRAAAGRTEPGDA